MTELFNTTFEISLRMLLLFSAVGAKEITVDRALTIDSMAIYGHDFGISEVNLHGDNTFGFSEFTSRESLIQDALRYNVINGLISVSPSEKGFLYHITKEGTKVANRIYNSYGEAYESNARIAMRKIAKLDDSQLLTYLNTKAVASLKEVSK